MNFFMHFGTGLAAAVFCAACASSGAAPGTIGAALGQQPDHRLFVRMLPPGEGGSLAGLVVDDEILAIDGKDVRTMSESDVRLAVRGQVGTVLVVTIRRGEQKSDVRVVRTPLLPPSPAK
jgi:carboxyl-terminal processing protease